MNFNTPRYLTPLDRKRVPHFFTDVLVIGGGLAGLRAALGVEPPLSALVITKEQGRESSSTYAQGGIAGVLDPSDRFEDHIADTLAAGGSLCDPAIVERVIREAPERIDELLRWGAQFDHAGQRLALGREGGHGRERIVHARGDATGKEVMRTVISQVRKRENVSIWEDTYTIDLLTLDGSCRGALVWNPQHGKTMIWAKQTILATGGAGQLYRETTNPDVATGDGMAVAYRAGAALADLEFMQFHPTLLYIAGGSRSLISEATRGEGAHLVDRHGHRFMPEFDPRAELAPRDVVSRAIASQMERTRHPNVYLDLTHLDPDRVRTRFPGIARICNDFNIDITREPIPVRPGAHYMMGGVQVDAEGRTNLPGLWAAGEATASGLHGANRLASNSLLEALVFGTYAGRGASRVAAEMNNSYRAMDIENARVEPSNEVLNLNDIRNSLKALMWRAAGVRRDAEGLGEAEEN
ncbi:MAG: L-aspartate oxidase, partial [Pirellulales bacterium]